MDLTKTSTFEVQGSKVMEEDEAQQKLTTIDLSGLSSEQWTALLQEQVSKGVIKKLDVINALKVPKTKKHKLPLKFAPTIEDLQMVYDAKENGESLESVIVKLNTMFRTFYREYDGVIHSLEYRGDDDWLLDGKDYFKSPSAAAVAVAGTGKSVSGPVFWNF